MGNEVHLQHDGHNTVNTEWKDVYHQEAEAILN